MPSIHHPLQHLHGRSRGDQLRGYYCCRIKSRKFYKYIFYFLLDDTTKDSKMIIKDFQLALASQLIGEYCSRHRCGRISSSCICPLPLQHFPVKVNDDSNPAKRKRGNCAHCRQTKHSPMITGWFCPKCSAWLCHSGDHDCSCSGTHT